MSSYRRVTYEDRCQIRAYLALEVSKAEIARRMLFHKSTISREISRNATSGYLPKNANRLARVRFKACRRPLKVAGDLAEQVSEKIQQGWSPEQIEGRFKLEQKASVSRESIYRFIKADKANKGTLWQHLRRPPRRGKNYYRVRRKTDLLRISARHEAANNRSRVGDWERDTMLVAERKPILVCVERKTRYLKIARLEGFNANKVGQKTNELLRGQKVLTITNDNGAEFRDHYMFECPVYYCQPYKPQQRGTVENTIGLLRQYLPSKTDLTAITDQEINAIEHKMNARPRRCLDYRTPSEVMMDHVALAV